MKQLFYSIIFISMLTACESTTKSFGEKFSVKNPVSVNGMLAQLQINNVLNDVQIEGKIEKSCMSEGCWFTIKDSTGAEILFDVKDKKFKVPTNSPGQTVVILADAQLHTEISGSKESQKTEVQVKGMMFK